MVGYTLRLRTIPPVRNMCTYQVLLASTMVRTRVPYHGTRVRTRVRTRAPTMEPAYHGTYVRTTETVLREAMQALVRVQAHMLARIVVEIRAADIAVELEPQL